MPTSSMSGGSFAPIENSPPGIQTMASGLFSGGGAVLTIVGSNDGADGATSSVDRSVESPRRQAAAVQPLTAISSAAPIPSVRREGARVGRRRVFTLFAVLDRTVAVILEAVHAA